LRAHGRHIPTLSKIIFGPAMPVLGPVFACNQEPNSETSSGHRMDGR
jgi:hypothetical protein